MPNHDDILRLEGISKAYPGVKALDNVGFSLKKARCTRWWEKTGRESQR